MREIDPIAAELRELRKRKGLSQNHVSVATGIQPTTLGAYERGDRRPPLHQAQVWAAAFGKELRLVDVEERRDA